MPHPTFDGQQNAMTWLDELEIYLTENKIDRTLWLGKATLQLSLDVRACMESTKKAFKRQTETQLKWTWSAFRTALAEAQSEYDLICSCISKSYMCDSEQVNQAEEKGVYAFR